MWVVGDRGMECRGYRGRVWVVGVGEGGGRKWGNMGHLCDCVGVPSTRCDATRQFNIPFSFTAFRHNRLEY